MSKEQQSSELSIRMSGLVINNDENSQNRSSSYGNRRERSVVMKQICDNFIRDINSFGISVLDGFLGEERGNLVFEEVLRLHKSGLFQEGQLVRNNTKNNNIRGDEIVWLRGNEEKYPNITTLINDIDKIVMTACKLPNNGKLGKYQIKERTKVMVACYPGKGAHYVKHVDNPHGDGRVITAIYYLNKNWQRETHGGILRIFPTDERTHAADIDPKFDRMLFFWSDRSNPHEVQPSFRTRYAITIWYYDTIQRSEAIKRWQSQQDEETDEDQKKKSDEQGIAIS